jgi:hypothetical protein
MDKRKAARSRGAVGKREAEKFLAIGDIHGNLSHLEQLLEKIPWSFWGTTSIAVPPPRES